jgi:Mg2+ and Co2+ transporter CorA
LWVEIDRGDGVSADDAGETFDLNDATRGAWRHCFRRAFQSLLIRFESTVQEARDAREAIVGSFDVLLARTGHRTNHIMKVLTVTSVILLPGALIAGVLGMNFRLGCSRLTGSSTSS